ncbi:MAG: SEC-C domain-containing protein [Clostridia bacterium]|nr:SEC-C domain-containing protein [Clostridia bacterium]
MSSFYTFRYSAAIPAHPVYSCSIKRNECVFIIFSVFFSFSPVFFAAGAPEKQKPIVKKLSDKVGRNDPCPCGSGKKYKQCCGRNANIEG